MKSLTTFRRHKTPWTRRVLGLFVVVWLNLALQPCAMAMGGGDDHDCPHCPPSHTQKHDGHAMASSDAGREMPCATGATDCSVLDDYNYDGRSAQVKVKDVPSEPLVTLFPSALFLADARPNLVVAHTPPSINHPPGPSLPLNILYCVYLK